MVTEINAAELNERLADGEEIQVIDIRPRSQFEREHIPGAENVPFTEFAGRVDEIDWADEVVVVCPKGESSLQAARLLESYEGIDDDTVVANMVDGYRGWEYELETGG
jgi:rhodanese-related sulfurtransferase